MLKKIVILHTDVAPNAGVDELDCLQQAQAVSEALIALGYEPIMLPFVMDLNENISALRALQPDVVFNLVETLAGRGSMIYFATALLDYLQIPYTGCLTDAMFLTSNKPLAKQMLQGAGIATPPWLTSEGIAIGHANTDTYILKPSWEDASVGLDDTAILRTTNRETLLNALKNRKHNLGMDCFAEAYIDGREFNIALLATDRGARILPVAEILFQNFPPDKLKFLDYRAKWVEDSFEYDNTRRSFDMDPQDTALIASLQEISLTIWHLFGLRGYARVDFRVDGQGNPFVLEINANPCLSPDAGFAAALEQASIQYADAIDTIIRSAIQF
ncbi:MAG: D-alanine--D-alanine ligase family protein [Smithellaceae bacterium]